MPVSTGQFTIIDYFDAISLTGFISSNLTLTQVYNPDNNSYNPSYASTNMVLTPSLFKAGSGNDLLTDATEKTNVQSIKWYDGVTEVTDGTTYGYAAFVSGTVRPLTIKQNVLTGSTTSKTYVCEIIFKDSGTGLNLTYKTSITINRISNSAGVTVPVVNAPSGIVFKNGSGSLTAKATLWRGAVIDSSSVTYQWFKQNGAGWDTLSSTVTGGGTSGWTTDTLTIPASAVTGTATFKCDIKDTDSTSPTYNQTFSSTVSFVDQTDPVQVIIESSAGDVFKQGNGSTTLNARVFQNGAEIDVAGTKYTYTWYKKDQSGNSANFYGTASSSKTGKTLAVGSNDVDVKGTFVCEIS